MIFEKQNEENRFSIRLKKNRKEWRETQTILS